MFSIQLLNKFLFEKSQQIKKVIIYFLNIKQINIQFIITYETSQNSIKLVGSFYYKKVILKIIKKFTIKSKYQKKKGILQ